ncbi:MAG: hypothetical protein A2381_17760 [Bdellovibrionales bacterium RIFOXYB1_FULL_37_110]|nr:MAG: hypothetical protein A2417_08550 [Bdellovibrionales bacterium RIFOXYC1_FULL_37_79]OFZ59819.1 MAG: hypothetical protein A2381_17760 [Bdellovibrionales bacterium RIFOXYB1_FULL_37_110]OFZ65433.1 MAG: hypothetical protein A2577_18295 [Bdellovibrionales bacterium RIFOXYD1_FULL_36_51]
MKTTIALSALLLVSNAFSLTCTDDYGNSNLSISTFVNCGNTYYQIQGTLKNKPFNTTYMEGGDKAKQILNDVQNGLCKPVDEDGDPMDSNANIPANTPNCTQEQMQYLGIGMYIMMTQGQNDTSIGEYTNFGFSKDENSDLPLAFFNSKQLLLFTGGCDSETLTCNH